MTGIRKWSVATRAAKATTLTDPPGEPASSQPAASHFVTSRPAPQGLTIVDEGQPDAEDQAE